MNTVSLPKSTNQSTITSPKYEPMRMVIGTNMKRLLGANDGYGHEVVRVAILDELNELARCCEVSEGFLIATAEAFSRLQDLSKDNSRRHRVMREALIAALADIQSFFQRIEE
jgi:hypothetical protein